MHLPEFLQAQPHCLKSVSKCSGPGTQITHQAPLMTPNLFRPCHVSSRLYARTWMSYCHCGTVVLTHLPVLDLLLVTWKLRPACEWPAIGTIACDQWGCHPNAA